MVSPLLTCPVGGTFQEAARRERAAPGQALGKRERQVATYNEDSLANRGGEGAGEPESGSESGGESGNESGNESDFQPTQDTMESEGSSSDEDDEELKPEVCVRPRSLRRVPRYEPNPKTVSCWPGSTWHPQPLRVPRSTSKRLLKATTSVCILLRIVHRPR